MTKSLVALLILATTAHAGLLEERSLFGHAPEFTRVRTVGAARCPKSTARRRQAWQVALCEGDVCAKLVVRKVRRDGSFVFCTTTPTLLRTVQFRAAVPLMFHGVAIGVDIIDNLGRNRITAGGEDTAIGETLNIDDFGDWMQFDHEATEVHHTDGTVETNSAVFPGGHVTVLPGEAQDKILPVFAKDTDSGTLPVRLTVSGEDLFNGPTEAAGAVPLAYSGSFDFVLIVDP